MGVSTRELSYPTSPQELKPQQIIGQPQPTTVLVPHRRRPPAVRRKTCRWRPWSSHCSLALAPCSGGDGGRAGSRCSCWPPPWRSGGSPANWTSSGPTSAPVPPGPLGLLLNQEKRTNGWSVSQRWQTVTVHCHSLRVCFRNQHSRCF